MAISVTNWAENEAIREASRTKGCKETSLVIQLKNPLQFQPFLQIFSPLSESVIGFCDLQVSLANTLGF